MPIRLADERFEELYAVERGRTQENFWRTRRKVEKKSKEKQGVNAESPAH